MSRIRNTQVISLGQAVEMFKAEFCTRYPQSRFLIDGEGYEDEDLPPNIPRAADHDLWGDEAHRRQDKRF